MPEVFGVGPTTVQLDWARLDPGARTITVGPCEVALTSDGGPGTVVVEGLAPGTTHRVLLDGQAVAAATTLAPPPGPVLSRVATLNDLHLGEVAIGRWPRLRSDPDPARAHPVWCVAAALVEMAAWGPDLLVLKGDLSDNDRTDEYELLARLLDGFPAPVVVVAGNHDGGNHRRSGGPARVLGAAGHRVVADVDHLDLPGIRVVVADSVWPGHDRGRLGRRRDRLAARLADAPGPALLAVHHQFMTTVAPTYVPPGFVGRESRRTLAAVAEANPATVVLSGHSHRHRVRHHGPLLLVEVGSPKDHPGTWASYEVHATGLVQTAHRIADPQVLRWTERTGHTAFGAWRPWSRGSLGDRCFVHRWPDAGS